MSLPNRRSIRLKEYDYSSNGAYFITICTKDRELLFGDIIDGKMVLNNLGEIVESVWESLPDHHPVELDQFQIMPNHIHMVIIIVGAGFSRPIGFSRPQSGFSRPIALGNIIAYFKYQSTKQINNIVGAGYSCPKTQGSENPTPTNQKYPKIFQRNYWEHVIRNDAELDKISWYIVNNPGMWDRDRNNPDRVDGTHRRADP